MNFAKTIFGLIALAILGAVIANHLDTKNTSDSSAGEQKSTATSSPQSASDGTDGSAQSTAQDSPPSNLGRPISPEERKKKVQTKDLVIGASKQAVSGSQVTFHIIIKLKDGKVVVDSRKDAAPWKGILGNGSMMYGLSEGLQGMFQGGKRAIWIPAHLAYGSAGLSNLIPPNTDLYAEVEMVSVF